MNQVIKTSTVEGKNGFLPLLTTLIFIALLSISAARAQLWKKVKDRVQQAIENKVTRQSADVTGAALDKAEAAVRGKKASGTATGQPGSATGTSAEGTLQDYSSYDFVPGDKIIFEPDISGETDAELPARFKLIKGNAEIQSDAGIKILHLDQGGQLILSPLMTTESYLPQQFTVEFDMAYENPDTYMRYVNFFDVDFQKSTDRYDATPLYQLRITSGSGCLWAGGGHLHFPDNLVKALAGGSGWHHVAIYVNNNVGKIYIDQYRVAASNTLATGAGKMALGTDGRYGIKIKNFRLASGGTDKYHQVITDGKFVTHGILFDVAKSTIQPSSAGTLHEVFKMMQSHPELKFEIDGHTDSDGAAAANLQLSEDRAAAVKAALVKMGIATDRLSTKGLGATQPIDSNDTQEGKANNRRVAFIKT